MATLIRSIYLLEIRRMHLWTDAALNWSVYRVPSWNRPWQIQEYPLRKNECGRSSSGGGYMVRA